MNILIIGLCSLYAVRGHAPEHREGLSTLVESGYADPAMAGPRYIHWPAFGARTGNVVDLETAKKLIWMMALNGFSFCRMMDSFSFRRVVVHPQFATIMKQMDAIKQIDAKYLDSVLDEILRRYPQYYERPFGEVLKQVLDLPLDWWPRTCAKHLRLFMSFCVDTLMLINVCPDERNIPMTFGDPVKVYVMPNSVYRNMLNKFERVLLMDQFVVTNPMYEELA